MRNFSYFLEMTCYLIALVIRHYFKAMADLAVANINFVFGFCKATQKGGVFSC